MVRTIAVGIVSPLLLAGSVWAQPGNPVSTIRYDCAQGRRLTAEYFTGPTRIAPNGSPVPGGHVILTLADGKKLTLPQTLSGSGVRYANPDESFVFWSKGDTAFVEEGASRTVTYAECVGKK